MSEQKSNPKNNFCIESIQGIQDLNDSNAEQCVGGSFKASVGQTNGLTLDITAPDRYLYVGLRSATGLTLENTTPGGSFTGDGNMFTLQYVNQTNTVIATERLAGGQQNSLLTAMRNNNIRPVGVRIYQDPPPAPSVGGSGSGGFSIPYSV